MGPRKPDTPASGSSSLSPREAGGGKAHLSSIQVGSVPRKVASARGVRLREQGLVNA